MSTHSIPVGRADLGRVLNARGEPIDHQGSLDDTMRQPLYVPDAKSARAGTPSMRVLETGIKVLDLMAPASYGSMIGMMAGPGLGLMVVAEELMQTLITRHQPEDSGVLSGLAVEWWFSRTRATLGLWPAIDPLASRSLVLESNAVSQEHRQVAEGVRDLLPRYDQLREQEKSGMLSEEDTLLLTRAERIDLFLTQPFVVAEGYSDLPGAYLTIGETIGSFRGLLDGRYDAVPAQAFNFVGRIEQE